MVNNDKCVSQPVLCVNISTTLSLNIAKIKTTPTLLLGHRDDSQINQYIHLESKCRRIQGHLVLLIIAWGKNPNKLSYLNLIAHVIGALC